MEEMNNVVETGMNEAAENAVEAATVTKGFNPKAGLAILAVAALGYGLYRLVKSKKAKAEAKAVVLNGDGTETPIDDAQPDEDPKEE